MAPSDTPAWPNPLEPGTDVDKPASQAAKAAGRSRGGDLLSLLRKHGVSFAMLLSVWGLGYFRFSWSWLLLATVLMVWRERNSQQKHLTMELARRATQNEKETILSAVNNLPSWVYFPDTERAEWLNKMVKQMWPFIEGYVVTMLRDTVEPAVLKALPSYLKSFKFETIKLGTYPPRIGGVKVYTDQVGRDEIILDLELFYAGNCDIEISVKALKRIKAGIESLQLHGTLRVEMKPLVDKVPLVGGMSIYFLNKPAIDFNLTNLADVLDIPGLSGILRTILEDQLANFLVLPNRLPIKLIDDVDISSLKYPMPQGVLRIHVIEAKNLVAKDFAVLSKGKSDPYCIVRVGSKTFKTKAMKRTLTPVWDKYFEAIVYQSHGQTLDIDVWDKDEGPGKDDALGTLSLNVRHVADTGHLDAWLPLQEIKQGDLHLELTWLTLTDSTKAIYERMDMNARNKEEDDDEDSDEDDTSMSAAILIVKLDSAKDLPISSRSSSLPHPYVTMTVGRDSKTSQVQSETVSPVWEEVFNFLVQSPSLQNLKVEVMDSRKDRCIGLLMLPIKNLLLAPNLALEQPFKLDGSGPHSLVTLKMCLRGLERKKTLKVTNPRAVLMSESSVDVDDANTDSPELKPTRETAAVFRESSVDQPIPAGPQGDSLTKPSQPDTMSVSSNPEQAQPVSDTELRKRLVQHSKDTEDAPLGKLQMTLRYSTPRNRLIIVVHKGVDIKRRGSDDPPDTYVRTYLLPDKSKASKRKTKEVKDTHEPVYDETLEYMMRAEEVSTRALQVTVKDSSRFISLSDPVIGQIEIQLGELDLSKATTEWYILKPVDSD
ncbi:extended synaptotagmin-2-like isoform X2 [Patiria miniata]|uniref:Extended synaptotagmin-2 n=1 Tax=Patiria miniata TaxID=46514 RepID=A0A914A3Q3_PATMI|nr:extended synaptotagmin-2-like isoform X2 [Patiria miniata]